MKGKSVSMHGIMPAVARWSDLQPDILADGIFCRLELVDFIRVGAVCRSWRSSSSNYRCRDKSEIPPWLALSSPDEPEFRHFYSLTEQRGYKIHLPEISSRHCFGSSEGFLMCLDDNGVAPRFRATNPVTGASIPFPSTAPLNFNYFGVTLNNKAILSPCRSIAVVSHMFRVLAFARTGDISWTALDSPLHHSFTDMIFHKGHLYALNDNGKLVISDLCNPSGQRLVCVLDGPGVQPGDEEGMHYYCPGSSLVESPCGSTLFLVLRESEISRMHQGCHYVYRTRRFQVFKLAYNSNNPSSTSSHHEWVEVTRLEGVAVFVGYNRSMMVSTRDFPNVKSNCIYFTNYFNVEFYRLEEQLGDTGVFDLEDGSIRELSLSDDLKHRHLNGLPPIWFTPAR